MSQGLTKVDYAEFQAKLPDAVTALGMLAQASKAGLEKDLMELAKIRLSQINQCAFCTQFHLNIARKLGVSQVKIDLLPVWREAGIYSKREMLAFEWAEALTQVPVGRPDPAIARAVETEFGQDQTLQLTLAIATTNTWNRIAGPLGFSLPIPAN